MGTPDNQWGSDSGNEQQAQPFSHEEYSLSQIGVFSAKTDHNQDPFSNTQRRPFCSQGTASVGELMESYQSDFFSHDEKGNINYIERR